MNHMKKEKQAGILLRLFNDVDPVGLASEEAPNEYMPEIKALIAAQPNFNDADEVARTVNDILARYFEGVTIQQDLLNQLASRIFLEFHDRSTESDR
jgi:hypothetical protein